MREELYAIAFHFYSRASRPLPALTRSRLTHLARRYSELLRDESVEVDLVSPTLPALKALCDRGFHMRNGPLATLPKVVNGMLSACLQNVDGMRCAFGSSHRLSDVTDLDSTLTEDVKDPRRRSRRGTTSWRACCSSLRCHRKSRSAKRSSSTLASSSPTPHSLATTR